MIFLGYHVDALISALTTIGSFEELVEPICSRCKLDSWMPVCFSDAFMLFLIVSKKILNGWESKPIYTTNYGLDTGKIMVNQHENGHCISYIFFHVLFLSWVQENTYLKHSKSCLLSISPTDFSAISYGNFSCRVRRIVSRTLLNQIVFSIVKCNKNPGIVLMDHCVLNITFS